MPTSTYADSLRKAKKEAVSDHDLEAIKLAEEKMKELEEQLSISLDLISARNGVQEWKQIHDLRMQFAKDLAEITKLTVKRAMELPNWFELCDPEDKKIKGMSEHDEVIRDRLKGKTDAQKANILAEMRLCAEEQRASIWVKHTARKRRRKSSRGGVSKTTLTAAPAAPTTTKKKTTKKTASAPSSVVS